MWGRPPLEIPGKAIRPPDKSGSSTCPNCGRKYSSLKQRRENGQVNYHCPYCNHKIK